MNETLLERIGRGDTAAVQACIDAYGGLVWSVARRFLSNRADAEEAVQEIFLEIWSTASRFDPKRGSESAFIGTIARRRMIDRLRKAKRTPALVAIDDQDHQSHDESRVEAAAEMANVHRAMTTMPPEQQNVVKMATWLGMSHSAIAKKTALPLGTVKSHLRRGLNQIRAALGEGS
ncbi:MAG: sigma-70 family RNA polymerase sigma factor [Myxococcota bacterium]